jgi:digeranylgeranylglycerophospholipid reductase
LQRLQVECDVLVVGAGPAGSSAARAAAEAGAKTLLIDRKKEIGTPVQCGEVIGRSILALSGLRIPRSAVCSSQDFTRFIVDRKLRIDNHEAYWRSVSVERKMLDKHLALQAARAGAMVHADARLDAMDLDDDIARTVSIKDQGQQLVIEPKIVVAADGVHSTVSKLMGRQEFGRDALAKGIEFEMVASGRLPPCMQIFIEPEIGLGYGWIIPKGDRRANVGIATVGGGAKRGEHLRDWIAGHPVVSDLFGDGKVLEVKSGDAPVPGFRGGPVKGNVLFAGDAAGQTLAFVGEGIMPSYICGGIAGQVAAGAAEGGLHLLETYDEKVREVMGEELSMGAELRDTLVDLWNMDELDGATKSFASALVMNELISPEDQEMIGGPLELETLTDLLRKRISDTGRDIRIGQARTAWKV